MTSPRSSPAPRTPLRGLAPLVGLGASRAVDPMPAPVDAAGEDQATKAPGPVPTEAGSSGWAAPAGDEGPPEAGAAEDDPDDKHHSAGQSEKLPAGLLTTGLWVPPELKLSGLALPEPVRVLVHEFGLRMKYRHFVAQDRGLAEHLRVSGGLVALFTGAPESSKGITAALLAREQEVKLAVVDLADALLRRRDEFGKEMRELLDAAGTSGQVVYIEGATGLLTAWSAAAEPGGQARSVALAELWAQLSAHDGVVILATTQRPIIDERALQRIHTIIDFPAQDNDPETHYQLLLAMFPEGKLEPPAERDLREIAARVRLSEAGLRNAVLDAAARAAADNQANPLPVSACHLVRALAREYQKLGRKVSATDFGERLFALMAQPDCGSIDH